MVTSRAVVGSSAITRAGRAGERTGNHQALTLAAGELVGVALEHGLGLRNLHTAQELDQMRAALPLGAQRPAACQRRTGSSWAPILNTGLSA